MTLANIVLVFFGFNSVTSLKIPNKQPEGQQPKLVTSCQDRVERSHAGTALKQFSKASTNASENYIESLGYLCTDPGASSSEYADQADSWVNSQFQSNYDKIFDKEGWLDEAYVAYFALPADDPKKAKEVLTQMTWLLKSVHQSSTRPVVAFNFGSVDTSAEWKGADFPRAVVLHARPMHRNAVFNFNKFRAMMLSKVRTGIMLDADEFVGPAADRLFPRIKEEINEDYPYIILPVHWFSRDPDPKFPIHPYEVYDFECKGCPERTTRWGHAHPTFTHHTLPFLAHWLRKTLDHDMLGDEPIASKEDEDVMNMATWDHKLTKQWCKFDIPFNSFWFQYLQNDTNMASFADPKWYPEGIPLVFYTAHHTVVPEESEAILSELSIRPSPPASSLLATHGDAQITSFTPEQVLALMNGRTGLSRGSLLEVPQTSSIAPQALPAPIFHKGKFYNSGKELMADHPDLKCII